MTDAELREWSRTRLSYSVEMVLLGGSALANLPPRRTMRDFIVKNAQLDAFSVNLRGLISFIFDPPKYADDVTADDFMTDLDAWRAARPAIGSMLQKARACTHKEVAHLTSVGLAGGPDGQGWYPLALISELLPLMRAFTTSALAARLDDKSPALIRDWEMLARMLDVPPAQVLEDP